MTMTDHELQVQGENVAATMRDVMEKLGATEAISDPRSDELLGETKAFDLTVAHLVSLPGHRKIEDLTRFHREAAEFLKPSRRKGTARLANLQSLITWTERFKGDNSVLYANPNMQQPTLSCIADYHEAGPSSPLSPTGDPKARHCHHRAVYDFPLSDEWKAWTGISGEPIEKDTLGEFIEAQAKDVMDPTPAIIANRISEDNEPWENRLIETAQKIEGRFGQLTQLLAMSKQFQVFETSNLKIQTNRDTGEQEVQFLSEHKTPEGKPLAVPNLIIIAIPVFEGGAPYRMPVRFRYRKVGGSVRFILSIYNPEKAFKAAFEEATTEATEATSLPLFFGTPEA